MPTVRSLDERIDQLEKDFVEFRTEVRGLLTIGKWLAGFAATTLILCIGSVIGVAFQAGQLRSDVQHQGEQIQKLVEVIDKLSHDISHEIAELRVEVAALRAEIRSAKKGI